MKLLSSSKGVLDVIAVVTLPLLLAGCATSGGSSSSTSLGQELVKEAQQALSSGAKIRAQSLLEEATRSNPTDKLPWLKLAQLHFEQNQYGQAITAGQEALARESSNLDARSIVLVSSLRIAAKSLEELSTANQLAGDTRTEAKKVAHILRETLGETVLVPANKAASSGGNANEDADSNEKRAAEKSPPKRQVSPARSKSIAHKPASAESGGGDSDPFRSLR